MPKLFKKISKKAGLRPGSVVFIGEKKTEKSKIRIIDYDAENLREMTVDNVEDVYPFRDTPAMSWINIDGLHEVDLIEKIGGHFEIHPLVLEDIVNTGQRPKIEESSDYVFVVLKMLYLESDSDEFVSEQVNLVFGKNFVLSFQEKEGDVFDSVRDRLRKTVPRVRFLSADYLAYTLIDAIVDHYYGVLEKIGAEVEEIEDVLIDNPGPADLENIHGLKRKLIMIRKATWPLREAVGGLERMESGLVNDATRPYRRDLYEHVIQVIDTVEIFRDMVSGLLETYMSGVSNKMNEIMKVLTIIATIFIPLGFLAGVYGMNFNTSRSPFNMPELDFPYGYILFWILAIIIGGGMFVYFKRKRWL